MGFFKRLSAYAFTIMLTTASFSASADEKDVQIVDVCGSKYYLYIAKKSDSLFGIARENGWDDSKLQEMNPTAVSPLRKGAKIYYPADAQAYNATKNKNLNAGSAGSDVYHHIERGETVYGIASAYGIPVERIYELNPSSRTGIKAGEELLISRGSEGMAGGDSASTGEPAEKTTDNGLIDKKLPNYEKVIIYTIKAGDSLSKIANDYEVSVASILDLNPAFTPDRSKAGDTIKIPKCGTGLSEKTESVSTKEVGSFRLYTAKKNDTWRSIAANHGVTPTDLKNANPDIIEMKKNQTVAIPVLTTVEKSKTVIDRDVRESSDAGVSEIYSEVHHLGNIDAEYTVNVAIVTESASANKDIEFIRGFLTGIDRLKREDYKINLVVADGTGSPESIKEKLGSEKPSVIFSLSEKGLPAYLSDFAKENKIYIVNTFDVKNEDYLGNPYIIQLLTPSQFFNESVAKYVFDKYGDYTLILTGDADSNDILASSLKKNWKSSDIRTLAIEDIEALPIAENGKYIFYGYPVKKGEVTDLLTAVNNAKQNVPLADVMVLGRPNWMLFDEALDQPLHSANAFIPSRFYVDKNSENYRKFYLDYKSLFNRNPVKSLPLYAAVGYDNAIYFISQLAKTRGDINEFSDSDNTIQSDFSLSHPENWSGYINPPVYLVRFTPYGTTDKIVINGMEE